MPRPPAARLSLVAIVVAATLLAGCGSDGDGAVPADCRKVAPATDGTSRTTVVGKDLAFDVECLEVQPGPLEITFENRDGGVAHDLHVTGNGIDERTDLVDGVITQVLDVTLVDPGSYTFACDPHGTMEGVIHVVDPGAPAPG